MEKRKSFSKKERFSMLLEVTGHCPKCDKNIDDELKMGKSYPFELAHIYPLNPTFDEILLLENEEKLSEDPNDLNNIIALCRDCHKIFDKDKTKEKYREMVNIKKSLIRDKKIRDDYFISNIEKEISYIIEKISDMEPDNIQIQNTNIKAKKIDQKINNSMSNRTKRIIKNDISDYFYYIQELFKEVNKNKSSVFEIISSQIKTFYLKCSQEESSQEKIYKYVSDWLAKKTGGKFEYCSVITSFFIQNCEVFSDDIPE